MALYDDKKKKLLDNGPQLVPGTPAAALAAAGDKYQAIQQAAGKVNLAKNLNFINPADPRSMLARPSNRGLAPAPSPATPAAQPAVAMPGASATQARQAPGGVPAPRNPAQLDQASQAEVAARTPARPSGTQMGAGAPSRIGRAVLRPDGVAVVKQKNGVNAYGATGASVADAQRTMGTVNQQNFGPSVVPQAQSSIARPGVASTFGQSVIDMPDQNAVVQRPGAFRNPDSRGEFYANKEDREAARALAGNLDTDVFRASFAAGRGGRSGRQAQDLIGQLRGTQAAILGGQAGRSADAVQGSAIRTNQFDIADMSQQGEDRRAELAAMVADQRTDVEREGNRLGYNADLAKTNASLIERPTLERDAAGNLISVAGARAQNVVDAQGNPVKGPQAKDSGAVTPAMQFEAYNDLIASAMETEAAGISTPEQTAAYQQRIADLTAKRDALVPGQGGKQVKRTGMLNGKKVVEYADGTVELAP